MAKTKKQWLTDRLAELKRDRTSWEPDAQSIADNMAPYLVVLDSEARSRHNDGRRRDTEIINSAPRQALAILAAGMMAGLTSPAREWFNLTVVGIDSPAVRRYLEDSKEAIKSALHRSNWYDTLSNDIYTALGSVATAAAFLDDDGEGGVHFTPLTFGQYWIDVNKRGEVDTIFHVDVRTVRQIVDEFGYDNCSRLVKRDFDDGALAATYEIAHGVFPNTDKAPSSVTVDGMAFTSCWWETSNPEPNELLRKSGYREFPALVPRWSTTGNDAYGRGPGHNVLGTCRALQHREKRKSLMVDLVTDPPLATTGLDSDVDLLPGATTEVAQGQTFDVKPLVVIPAGSLNDLRQEIAEYVAEINAVMFVNLWQATIGDERLERATATEVEARRQEVMLMLGPLLQSLDRELLGPCIRRVFSILDRNDVLPLPPPELEGGEIKVEFISIMHQAQQSTGIAGLRALVAEVMELGQVDQTALDKLNVDAIIDLYASMYGVSVDALREDKEIQQIRQARAQAQQQQMQQAEAMQVTEGAKNLGMDAADLGDVAGALSPVAGAQSGGGGL